MNSKSCCIAIITILGFNFILADDGTGLGIVNHAPNINAATVEGSLQMRLPENVNLNGEAKVTQEFRVPGNPTLVRNGNKTTVGSMVNGTGSASPSNYQVRMNGKASIGTFRRRVDALPLPTVPVPAAPTGTRSVNVNGCGQNIGSWSTIRNLTLNSDAGSYAVPPGRYGNFTVNEDSTLILGTAGATTPSVYSFQTLTVNNEGCIRVVGPVIVTVDTSLTMNGESGACANPFWFDLRLARCGLNLNGESFLSAKVTAPNGTVTLNGESCLTGSLICNYLNLNGESLLRLCEETTTTNQPPVALSQTVTTAEDSALAITLSGTDTENAPLTYTVLTQPTNGTLTGTAPALSYTPAANSTGTDSFTFRVNDGTQNSATATVSITITPVNDAPVASPQSVSLAEDTPTPITLTGSDVEGSALTYSLLSSPVRGVLSGTLPNLTYTPQANYNGPDSFTFRVSDGAAFSASATVSLTVTPVQDVPVASSLNVTLAEDASATLTLGGTDPDNDPLQIILLTQPANGVLSGSGENRIYTPAANFHGTDSFTYRVSDGAQTSAVATVSLTITPENDAPLALPATISVVEDTAKPVTLSASDVDGGLLTYQIVTPPSHGTLSGTAPALVYTPAPDFHGEDSFTFLASDGVLSSPVAAVSLIVTPVNDAPVVSSNVVTTPEDTATPIVLSASDVDGDVLSYTVTAQPAHGTLSGTAPNLVFTPAQNFAGTDSMGFTVSDGTVSVAGTISLVISPVNDAPSAVALTLTSIEDAALPLLLQGTDVDGDALTYTQLSEPQHGTLSGTAPALTYTPNTDFHGADSFSYVVSDGQTASAPAAVVLTITPVNDLPLAQSQTITTPEDTAVALTLAATDVDDDTLTYQIVTQPAHGTLSGTAPAVTYTPAANYAGSDTFTFKVNDGTADSTLATVSIEIGPMNDRPYVADVAVTTPEDQSVSITADGFDWDFDALSFAVLTSPAHGSLTTTAEGWTYTPEANFHGTDSFVYRANDGLEDSDPATVTITVTPVNDAPLAQAVAVSTDEDVPVSVTLLGSDLEGGTLSFEVVTQPQRGTLSGTAPALTYTPSLNQHGADTFTYRVNDGDLSSATATVTITITPVNDTPLAQSQSLTLAEDGSVAVTLAATDDDGDALSFTITTAPQHGTLSGTVPNVTYTPAADFHGSDSFAFTASDGTASSSPAIVTLAVTPVNDLPLAQAASFTTDEDTAVAVTLGASDVDGDALTYAIVSQSQHGTLSGTAPDLTFTPAENFAGNDSFSFKVNDGTADSAVATVSITINPVNDVPVALASTVSTPEDTAVVVSLVGTDVEGDTLTYQITQMPQNGVLSGNAPDLTYTPASNFHGADLIRFRVSDGQAQSAEVEIPITVTPVNDAPIAVAGAASTPEDTAVPVLLIGTDVDGDTLSYQIVTPPSHGVLSGNAPNLTFTPALNFNGGDSFTFTVSDGTAVSAPATFTIAIGPENDAPEAFAVSVTLDEDSPANVTASTFDLDGDVLSLAVVSAPQHGTLTATSGGWTYTPEADYHGADSFTYRANDGLADSAPATVSIQINPVNDVPVASALSLSTAEDTVLNGTLSADDQDGDTLTFALQTAPQHGLVAITGSSFTYTPDADYHGEDSFAFTANDGTESSAPATISLTVTPVNDAPTATPTSATLAEDSSAAITLSGVDVENDALSFVVIGSPSHGSLSGTAPNLTYTPAADYHGADTFTFRVNDGQADSAVATVSITVNPVNDVPVASAQSVTVAEDSTVLVTLSADDVDGDSLTYQVATQPAHGTLNGLIYTPNADFSGTDSFNFTADDGTAASAAAVVSITVTPVNDAPVAQHALATTAEDAPVQIPLSATDTDQDTLGYTLTALPTHGTATLVNGIVTYTPDADYHGADSFSFQADDGQIVSNIATVQITITPVNDAPTANAIAATGNEDAALSITLSGNDVDGDALTFEVLSQPAHGTLNGLVYTPDADFSGADTFTFRASDGTTFSSAATVSITVNPVNDVPVALTQQVTTQEDTAVSITLAGSDVDGDVLTYQITTPPSHGSLSGTAPNLTYTPNADYNGNDSFAFTVADAAATSAPALVSIVVGSENDAPVASPVAVTLAEDGSANVTAIVSDAENDTLTLQVVIAPQHGTLAAIAGGWTYTPDTDYHGTDSFTYRANDGMADSAPALVSLTVSSVNDLPIASTLSVNAIEDTPLMLTLTGTDVEDATSALIVAIVVPPQHGTLQANGLYTPELNYAGTDTFSFTLTDSEGAVSAPAAVGLTILPVNDAPLATTQALTTLEDTSTQIVLTGSDTENDELGFEVLTTPVHGTLSGIAPNLTYTPVPNFHGSDTFSFRVSDQQSDSVAESIVISVTPVNDIPLSQMANYELDEDENVVFSLSGSDIDGDTLSFNLTNQPAHGSLSGTAPNLTYTPAPNFHGTDSFSFITNDGIADSAPATVQFVIASVNDAPTALSQSLATEEDTPLPITLGGMDVDGDTLTFNITSMPTHGSLSGTGSQVVYTPASDYFGVDSFDFAASDGAGSSVPMTVTVLVSSINDAPLIATLTTQTINEDTPLTLSLDVTDADNDPITLLLAGSPANGQVSFNGLNLTYTPNANYFGNDSFALKATDGTLNTEIRVVSINITPVNDAPIAQNQSLTYINGTPLFLPLMATDVDGDTLTYDVVAQPSKGQITTLPRGTSFDLAYLPNAGGSGEDTLTFVANDGQVDSNQGTLTITLGSLFTGKSWTTTADFYEGSLGALSAIGDRLTLSLDATKVNFVNVPLNDGRLLRIDPDSGQICGEYRTAPDGVNALPSRTAVDMEGNIWVANRGNNSLTMIAAPSNGRWVDRNGNGSLDTSSGITDCKPWPTGGQAVDELITLHVPLQVTTPNSLAMSYDNRIIVGGGGGWQWLSWPTGTTLDVEPSRGLGGFGSMISTRGVHWSSGKVLRWPLGESLIEVDLNGPWNDGHTPWCIAESPDGSIWTASEPGSEVRKYTSDGRLIGKYKHGWPDAQGIVADLRGHVWVAHTHCGSTVGHLAPDGNLLGVIKTATGPVAVDVDRMGRVWVISGRFIQRIDPNAGAFSSDGLTKIGAVDLTIPLPGYSRAYSQFARPGQVIHGAQAEWTAVFDSGLAGAAWEPVRWNAEICNDGFVGVSVALSSDGVNYGSWQTLESANAAPAGLGRYIQVKVNLVQNGSLVSPTLKDITVGTTGYPISNPATGWSVSAGDDFTTNWPTPLKLRGNFCHTDQPGFEGASYSWTQVSGPAGGQLIINGAGPEPLVNFTTSGDYVLRFSVTLNGITQSDDVNVKLLPINQPPAISVRQRHYVRTASDALQIRPEITDDGQGSSALSATWQLLSGPPGTTATFTAVPAAGVGAVDVTLSGGGGFPYSFAAEYLFKVTATDGLLSNSHVISMRRALTDSKESPSGMMSWWEMNDSGEEHMHGNSIFPEQNARFITNSGTRALELLGTNDRARAFASESLNVAANGQGLSLEFWMNDAQASTGSYATQRPIMGWSSATGYTTHLTMTRASASAGTLTLRLLGRDGVPRDLTGTIPSAVLTGSYPLMHVVATYDVASQTARLMVNDSVIASQHFSTLTLDTTGDFIMGAPVGGGSSFAGYLKHVRLYDRALTEAESYICWKAGLDGLAPPDNNTPPVPDAGEDIIYQPENYSLVANGNGPWPVISITGSTTDDGRTNVTPAVKTTWRFIYPRGNISGIGTSPPFSNINGLTTDVTVFNSGVFLLELTTDDGSFTRRDYRILRAGRITNSSGSSGPSALSPDLLAWWPFLEASKYDLIGQLPLELKYDAFVDDSKITFDGSQDYARVSPTTTFDFTNKPGFTMEFNCVDSNQTTGPISGDAWFAWQKAGQNILSLRRFYLSGSSWKLRIDGIKSDGQPFSLEAPWTGVSNSGANQSEYHHQVSYDRATGRLALLQDGFLRAEAIVGDIQLPDTDTTLYLGGVPGESVSMKGWLDDVSIYSRGLRDQEAYDLSRYNIQGKQLYVSNKAPVVNAGPDRILGNAPQTINLQGAVTDDNQPNGYPIKSNWSVVKTSYSSTVPITNINSLTSSITFPANGTYLLRLIADDGELYGSDLVAFQVGSQTRFPVPDGTVAWWPFDGDSKDIIQGINAELRHGASFNPSYAASTRAGLSLSFGNVLRNSPDHAFVNAHPGLDFTTKAGFTCEFWATDQSSVSANAPNNKVPLITWHNGQQPTLQLSRQYNVAANSSNYLTLEYRDAQGQWMSIGAVRPIYTSVTGFSATPTHLAITYDAVSGDLTLYGAGSPIASVNSLGIQMPGASDTMYLGTGPGTTLNQSGVIDELTLYDRALSMLEINEIANIPSAWGKLPKDGNQAPVVDAGLDRDVPASGVSITLTGIVSDDGLPTNSSLRTTWSVLDYAGVTSPSFGTAAATTTTVNLPVDGVYVFQLTADDGTRSTKDTVTVRVGRSSGTKAPRGLAAWWPFNGTGQELVRGRSAEFSSGVEFASFYGVNGTLQLSGSDVVRVPADRTLDFSSSPGLSIEFGLQDFQQFSTGTALPRIVPWLTWSEGTQIVLRLTRWSTTTTDLGRQGVLTLEYLTASGLPQSVGLSVNQNWDSFRRFLLSYDKTSGVVTLYANGAALGTAQIGQIQLPSETADLNVGWKPSTNTQTFGGYVDELCLYARALSPEEVTTLSNVGIYGKEPLDGNQAPLVRAGGSYTSAINTFVNLSGTSSDDGIPSAYTLGNSWTLQTLGFGTPTFGSTNTPASSFRQTTAGLCVLRLRSDDGALSVNDYAEVRVGPGAVAPPANLVAWWPFNHSLYDIGTGNHLAQAFGAPIWQTYDFVGTYPYMDGTDDRMTIQPSAALDFTGSAGFTVDALVYDNAAHVASSEVPWLVWHDGTRPILRLHRITAASGTDYWGTMALDYIDSSDVEQTILLTPNERADTRRHVALTYDAASGEIRYYSAGVLKSTTAVGNIRLPSSVDTLHIANAPSETRYWRGGIDELSLYSRALTQAEISSIVTASTARQGKLSPPRNQTPQVKINVPLTVRVGDSVSLNAAAQDDGLPSGSTLSYLWSLSSGPFTVIPSSTTDADTTAVFSETGIHRIECTVSDGQRTGLGSVDIRVLPPLINEAPTLTLFTPALVQLPAIGNASISSLDDGLPTGSTLSYSWSKLSGPGDVTFSAPTSTSTQMTFSVAGSYVIAATVTDGVLSTNAQTTISVLAAPPNRAPSISWISPSPSTALTTNQTLNLKAAALDADDSITQVQFFDGSNLLATDSSQPYEHTITGVTEGSHAYSATVTSASGQTATTVTLALTALTPENPNYNNIVTLTSPSDSSVITAPTSIRATIDIQNGYRWVLQRRLTGARTSIWQTFASGEFTGILNDEVISSFDPTLLENGSWDIRLQGHKRNGLYYETPPTTVQVDGAMKLGQFTLAFEDFTLDAPGVPISVTRTYDSRVAATGRPGDYGPGWRVGLRSVTLSKSGTLGSGWYHSLAGFINVSWLPLPIYNLSPVGKKRLVITFPDGRCEIFETTVITSNSSGITVGPVSIPATDSANQYGSPINVGKIGFRAVGASRGSLRIAGADSASRFINVGGSLGDVDLRLETNLLDTFDASTFLFTDDDGTEYTLNEFTGLQKVKDRNGNELTIGSSEIAHSNGQRVLFTRDAAGRITALTDPAGNQVLYSYNSLGTLGTVTDRVGSVTTFQYQNNTFPYHLTGILDPRGIQAIRTEYDAQGRMIRQIDADGNPIVLSNNVAARTQRITDRLGHITTHHFDLQGNITSSVDPLGGITTRTYDAYDNEITTTDPLGHTTRRTFDAQKNVLTETDALGNVTHYSYNSKKQPLTITDPLGRVTSFAYDSKGNMTSITDALGRTTGFVPTSNGSISRLQFPGGTAYDFTLDSSGNKTSQVVRGSDGKVNAYQTYTYNSNGDITSQADFLVPSGAMDVGAATKLRENVFAFDAEGKMTAMQVKDATGNVLQSQSWTYNANGDELTYTDPLGKVSTQEYDAQGRNTRSTYPDGTESRLEYDAEAKIKRTVNRSGGVMLYEFDALGRQTKQTNVDGTFTTSTFDAAGRETSKTNELGQTTTLVYDDADRLLSETNAAGETMTYTLDAAGNNTAVTDALNRTSSTVLDLIGRPTRTNNPDGTFAEVTYDAAGRIATRTDEAGNSTRFEYDPQGRLLAVVDALNQRTSMVYDNVGRLQNWTDAMGNTTSYTHDTIGRRTSRTLPGGQHEHMTWDSLGRLLTRTDFNGYTTSYFYDDDHRLVEKRADAAHPSLSLPHAAAKVFYTYNQFGQPETAQVLNASGGVVHSQSWTYDLHGQLTGTTTPHGSLGYTRDDLGQIASLATSHAQGPQLTYARDNANRIAAIDDHRTTPSRQNSFGYTLTGALSHATVTNGMKHSFTRNPRDYVTALGVTDAANAGIESFNYTLNALGQRERIDEGNGRVVQFQRDALSRLTQESMSNVASPFAGTINYTHNANGYRTQRSSTQPSVPNQTFTLNANGQLDSASYDVNGNTTVSDGNNDIYDFEDRLIRRIKSDGTVIDLVYDANGQRVEKRRTGSQPVGYLIDTQNPTGWPQCVAEVQWAGNAWQPLTTYTYGPAGPISQWNATQGEHHFLLDVHGTVRALVDAAGQVVSSMDYDSHGVPLSVTPVGAPTSSLGYNGEHFDLDLGLIYLRARWYNPTLGRFHTRDPYQGMFEDPMSLQGYLFAHGDPESMVDPSGNLSLAESLNTIRTLGQNFAQSVSRLEKSTDPAVMVTVDLWVAANLGASIESVLAQFMDGSDVMKAGLSSAAGVGANYAQQAIALAESAKYQFQLLEDFNKETKKRDASDNASRLVLFSELSAKIGNSIAKHDPRVRQKRNGLPEFTPHTSLGASEFIGQLSGSYDTDRARSYSKSFIPVKGNYRWHHHEVMGIMQAVPEDMHRIHHYGGVYFWKTVTGRPDAYRWLP